MVRKMGIRFLVLLMTVLGMTACGTSRTVPLTGRTQNLLVSDQEILSLSNQEYTNFMKTARVSTNATQKAMVQRVGTRLATAVENYLRSHGMAAEVSQFSWTFNLVQDKSVNAFCMPGGKIVVYEGLLPYTKNEEGLAIVLGHEIAHAVAKHSAEQISQQYRQAYGTQLVGGVLNAATKSNLGSYAGAVAQMGFKFQNLKYSRNHEYEADRMGLIFAAMAGYNPQEAIPFWKRMSASPGNGGGNDFFSDHPSDEKRIVALQQHMPEALSYYNQGAKASATSGKAVKSSATPVVSKTIKASQLYKQTQKK